MDFNQYQDLALKTANSTVISDNKQGLLNTALGLCGESGEFADAIKKSTFQGHEIDRENS